MEGVVRRGVLGVALACALLAAAPAGAGAARWTFGPTPDGIQAEEVVADPAVAARAFLRAEQALWVTEDRGRHWTPATVPDDTVGLTAFAGPPTLLVAVTITGDIWRSSDLGRTWTRRGCCAVALDPGDASLVLARDGRGLLRSADGGATFHRIASPPTPSLDLFTFHVAAGQVLYATTDENTTYRSTDGGRSWHLVTGVPEGVLTPVRDVVGRLWVGGFRSIDDAGSWQRSGPAGACDPAIAPVLGTPGVLWALGCGPVYRSGDGGDHWAAAPGTAGFRFRADTSVAPLADGSGALVLGQWGPWLVTPGREPEFRAGGLLFAGAGRALIVDPRLANTAYLQGFTSHDGGRTWAARPGPTVVDVVRVGARILTDGSGIDSEPADGNGATRTLLDLPAQVFGDPRGHRAWMLLDGTLWTTGDGIHLHLLLGNPDGFLGVDGDLGVEPVVAAAGGRGRTVAVSGDLVLGGFQVSRDGGRTFHARGLTFEPSGLLIDAIDGRLMLAFGDTRLMISRDAGRHFRRSVDGAVAIAVDPDRRGHWFAGTATTLYETRDAGHSWRPVAPAPGRFIVDVGVGAGRLWVETVAGVASRPLAGLDR